MPDSPKRQGPRFLRVLVIVFSCILGVLVYWLLGFVFDDIDTLRGPDYSAVTNAHLDAASLQQEAEFDRQLAQIARQTNDVREKQALLKESTSTSQQTLNQLLEMQRVNIQKGIKPSEAELKVFSESQRSQGVEEYQRLARHHELLKAGLKLLVLIPLVLMAARLFITKRNSLFAPLLFACGIAVLVHLVLVIHDYFPSRYFKYIVVLFAIAVVVQILVYLIRVIASPKKPWLLKQYREAYLRFCCPVCSYPIRRGPLKYLLWSRQARKSLAAAPGPVSDDPYACPACGTMLFEACASCHAVRHSLLTFCEKCGAPKEIVAPALTT